MSWGARFDDPIALANGRKLLTLQDAATYIANLPKKESDLQEWQAAILCWSPITADPACLLGSA